MQTNCFIFQVWTKDYLVKQGLTTQKAELLMSGAIHSTSGIERDIILAERCLSDLARTCQVADSKTVLAVADLPSVSTLYTLDTVLAHVQVALDDQISKSSGSKQDISPVDSDVASRLLPSILSLVRSFSVYIRSYLLGQVKVGDDINTWQSYLNAYNCVARIASNVNTKLGLGSVLAALPAHVRGTFEKWNTSSSSNEFPAVTAWRSAFAGDIIPAENYIDAVRGAHLAASSPAGVGSLLRHVQNILVTFAVDLATVWGSGDAAIASSLVDVLLPLSCEVTADGLYENVCSAVEKLVGPVDSDEMMSRLYACSVPLCRDVVIEHAAWLDEQVVQEALRFLESGLDRAVSRGTMEMLFANNDDLLTILLSANGAGRTPVYGTRVLKFFNKLVQISDKNPGDSSCMAMCRSLCKLANLESSVLQEWVNRMMILPSANVSDDSKTLEHRALLQNLTSYIVKESSHVGAEVASAFLSALIPMGSQVFTIVLN